MHQIQASRLVIFIIFISLVFVTHSALAGSPTNEELQKQVEATEELEHENRNDAVPKQQRESQAGKRAQIAFPRSAPLQDDLIESAMVSKPGIGGSPDGRFLAVCPTPERQDGLGELVGYDDLVAVCIVMDGMHGPSEQRRLSFDPPNGLLGSLRQPGEGRNLRMGHSVGDQ